MSTTTTDHQDRKDVIWQQETVAANYREARRGIPFVDVHFDIVQQVIEAHELSVHRVLDLGCGDGIATAALLGHLPIEQAVLVDFSEPMLAEACRKLGNLNVQVDYVWGDLLDSQWRKAVEPSGPFDLVISRFAIHHLPHARKRSLYGEVLELLQSGGVFINIEHIQSLSPVYERAFYKSLAKGIYRVEGGTRSLDEIEAMYTHSGERAANILAPLEDQLAWLRGIGFVDVDCAFKALELAVFGGRKP